MRILFYVLAALPLVVLQGIGNLAGAIVWWTNGSRKRIALINIGLCMPELPDAERRRIARASIAHEFKTYLETPKFWLGGKEAMERRVKEYRNVEVYDRALQKGKGVLLLTLHMGAFEAVAIPMSGRYTLSGLYRAQPGVVDELSVRGRSRFGGKLIPVERGMREKVEYILRNNEGLYYMPDHEPPKDSGVFAPFMGIPAHTTPLVARLVQSTGCDVVFMFGERLSWGRGYIGHYIEAPPGIDDPDLVKATTAVNRGLEACVRACPEQYWWGYKRFRRQPPGMPRHYR